MDIHVKHLECFCEKGVSTTCPAGGTLDAHMSVDASVSVTVEAQGFIDSENVRGRTTSVDLDFLASLPAKISANLNLDPVTIEGQGIIDEELTADYSVKQTLDNQGELQNTADKINGDFLDFECTQKLFPSGDLPIDGDFTGFVSNNNKYLFSTIDEGVYQGRLVNGGDSVLLSDDITTFLRPDSQVNTEGFFQYKCSLTDLTYRPDKSRLRMRISAPLENIESRTAPLYRVYDIKLLDPNDDLIIKYEDLVFKGDSHFTTYSIKPEINTLNDYDWERRTSPDLHLKNNYSLVFSLQAISLDDPFDQGFNKGFEENYVVPDILIADEDRYLALGATPPSTHGHYINPTENFKLSALEICNSGGIGPRLEDYIAGYVEVDDKGIRLERKIYPSYIPCCDFDTTIWPLSSGLWSDNKTGDTNEDTCGSETLVKSLIEDNERNYITLDHVYGPEDSGKLILKFSTGPSYVSEVTKGAFNFQFDQGHKDQMWWQPSGAFNTENTEPNIQYDNPYYDIDTITLRIIAKKDVGSRDYVLDVVGYSDDKLLAVTPASGGFLQDPSGVWLNDVFVPQIGHHPVISGFYKDGDDFALAAKSISEKEKFFEASGNDHYKLTQYPQVDGFEFKEYEIPLTIIDEKVKVGLGRDYSLSSLFEHLYLDIYPLPSGASIAHAALCVRYKPQDGIKMFTQGGEIGRAQDGRTEGALYPTVMGDVDDKLNAGSGYGPISSITNIPHAYTSPDTIKTNYSRKWRGVEGTVRGPYDPDMFGFGFENPVMDYPFASGYYKFDNIDGRYVQSSFLGEGFGNSSGLFTATPTVYQNIGWRYTADTANGLFQAQLPGYTGVYKTSDWTSLTDGTTDFTNDPLYGKISDAFDNTVRVSQNTQNITFSDIDVSTSGFSVFLRFTPDNTVSGVNYDLFESGVLVSRWETPNDMDFVLCYRQGALAAYAKDNLGNVIGIKDNVNFTEYTYPVSVLLTYSDDKKLRLYADNEASGIWQTKRAESAAFDRNTVDADIVVGWSAGSGVGMNMLVSEVGVSSGNIVDANPDLTTKQVTAETFLENIRIQYLDPDDTYQFNRYKLWDRVNEDTYNDWQIGAFKYCPFGPAFDQLQVRPNKEQIIFDYVCDGTPYFAKTTKSLPDFVNLNKQGVAYHTQLENDFLRFHLSDVPDHFYSAHRRITKDLPTNYKFSERALVVESVLEHSYSGDIVWNNCDPINGPKLIVSLYTKAKEAYWDADNPYGLVNRKIHYIQPSSCLHRLDSTFSYDDLCEETESWSIFPRESMLNEFKEKYFTDDINKMFVQYDLVYPTGTPYRSKIKLHSSHVRMSDANIMPREEDQNINMNAQGAYPSSGQINLTMGEIPRPESGVLSLQMQIPLTLEDNSFPLYTFGDFVSHGFFDLYTHSTVEITGNLPLYTSGDIAEIGVSNMSLSMPNTLDSGSASFSMYTIATGVATSSVMPMFTYAAQDTAVRNIQNLYLQSAIGPKTLEKSSGDMSFATFGMPVKQDIFTTGSMPLYTFSNQPTDTLPLYITNFRTLAKDSGIAPLNITSYGYTEAQKGYVTVTWDGDNYGSGIEVDDEPYATVSAMNEIRGVSLTGYGSCTGDSPSKAIDQPLITDGVTWREAVCNEAGAFRAKATYSNSGALSFDNQTIGYEDNYYGIRKFTNLHPSVSYTAKVTIKTGDTDAIPRPRNFEDWEYGTCGPDWYTGGCCTEDCDQNLAYSGVKLIADESNLTGIDPIFLIESGRSAGDKYGSSVAAQEDLMIIGAPNVTLPDVGGVESSGAGAVFVYRRGEDVPGKKASWTYEDLLVLPEGYRKDYIDRVIDDVITFEDLSIKGNIWNIGQEGRRLGSSVDLASSGDREVAVVGAPKAEWFREFDEILSSGIKTTLCVITDKYAIGKKQTSGGDDPLDLFPPTASYYNNLYKYFSAPWYSQEPALNEFQPNLEFNLIVLELTKFSEARPEVVTPDWVTHRYIPSLSDVEWLDSLDSNREIAIATTQDMMKDIFIDAYLEVYPTGEDYRDSHIYSGVPAIMGIFADNSISAQQAYTWNNRTIHEDIKDFYQDFSFESGVFDQIENKEASGYVTKGFGDGANWANLANNFLNNLLSTGNLLATQNNFDNPNMTFISSGVGQEWGNPDLTAVNFAPDSGGRVFVFEKERSNWNCVQVIDSPTNLANLRDYSPVNIGTFSNRLNDRFGHSVAISKNSEVISVGSPYIQSACRIYERSQEEINRLYNGLRGWFVYKNDTESINKYDEVANESGTDLANIIRYDALTPAKRFEFRNDKGYWGNIPEQYKFTYDYKYSDIQITGTNLYLTSKFVPTSRLGWSTSVDDEGDSIAFGAPTDSLNEFDDAQVWGYVNGTGLNTWASYNYAGAVRMFENRKYYPHSGVVEFGLFGNLDRSYHAEERELGYYDHWESIFDKIDKSWTRSQFSQVDIPKDAGLAFIITPEIDAASDEVIQNIKDWLALGDRNLVLVGNDPTWEENGLYEESNKIINKILDKLGVDMRILPAESEFHSYGFCADTQQNEYNVTPARIPNYSSGPSVRAGDYYASGVGDIRIDLSRYDLENFYGQQVCPEGIDNRVINTRCNMPLKHHGDLRAEWVDECRGANGKPVSFFVNWPHHYGPSQTECDFIPVINKPEFDPVPVLTIREYIPPKTTIIPEYTYTQVTNKPIYETKTIQKFDTVYEFEQDNVDNAEFIIYENEDSVPTGIFTDFNIGTFDDPDPKNNRDPLLQAVGRSEEFSETDDYNIAIYPEAILSVVESGRFSSGELNNSKVYMLASQWSEDDASMGFDNDAAATSNSDANMLFYLNMVHVSSSSTPKGIHLGGWTGSTSLKDAMFRNGEDSAGHSLFDTFNLQLGAGQFEENKVYIGSQNIPSDVDFVWIANPQSKPDVDDVSRLRRWMDKGNKKLIITFNGYMNNRQDVAANVEYICDQLDITSKPIYDSVIEEYAEIDGLVFPEYRTGTIPLSSQSDQDILCDYSKVTFQQDKIQKFNPEVDAFAGFAQGYPQGSFVGVNTEVTGLDFNNSSLSLYSVVNSEYSFSEPERRKRFIPLSLGSDAEKIVWFDYEVVSKRYITETVTQWTMDQTGSIDFDIKEGSGYRVFVNFVSENKGDAFDLWGTMGGMKVGADPDELIGNTFFPMSKTPNGQVVTLVRDFRATDNNGSFAIDTPFGLYGDGTIPPDQLTEGVIPKSVRLLSMSGCFLPINETVVTSTYQKTEIVGYETIVEQVTVPEQVKVTPGYWRPYQELSERYCPTTPRPNCEGLGKNLIENGPVVLAEQRESFSSFPAGRRRSRIIVISDSTMVQGQCPAYRFEASTNPSLIRSLYPPSPNELADPREDQRFFGAGSGPDFRNNSSGRHWYFSQKIRSPERGSAAKYYSASGNALENNMIFPLFGTLGSVGSLSYFVGNEDSHDPRTVIRPKEITEEDKIEDVIEDFAAKAIADIGQLPIFSGEYFHVQDQIIMDAKTAGGFPDVLVASGHDYLDLDFYYVRSGCMGDLFGYSVDLSQNKLIVGSPFNAYYSETGPSGGLVEWADIGKYYTLTGNVSGIKLAEDGGAGAAFVFNKTGQGRNVVYENLPWEFNTKIKPSSVNIGITTWNVVGGSPVDDLIHYKGPTDYADEFKSKELGSRSDNFGYSVAIDYDMAAVGAPNHDFETLHHHIYQGTSAFLRKSFDGAFDIPLHSYYDLGNSGIRIDEFEHGSGQFFLNAGAVFTFRNEMVNIPARQQQWIYAEKIYPQGYKSRESAEFNNIPAPGGFVTVTTASGSEADAFGKSVAITRSHRGDADYVLIAGSPDHHFETSGTHHSSREENAGAAYTFDAMLRGQTTSIPNGNGWMDVKVYSNENQTNTLFKRVYHNETGGSQTYIIEKDLPSNTEGEIFLEVSGYDPSNVGFIAHRPYVESIELQYLHGTGINSNLGLYVAGQPVQTSGNMDLYILGDSRATVYNNMNNYVFGAYTDSGSLNLTTFGQDDLNGNMNMFLSSPDQTNSSLSIKIRGY